AAPDRRSVLAALGRAVEQDFQEIGRAHVAGRLEMNDRVELLLGVADPAWDDRAAERVRARLQDERAGREMIRKSIVHDVAGPKAGREQRPRATARVVAKTLGLEDRTGRHVEAPDLAGRRHVEAAERG